MSIQSHSVIIISEQLDGIINNATNLKANVATLDTAYQGMSPSNIKSMIHNHLVQVQGCLTSDTDEWSGPDPAIPIASFKDTSGELCDMI